MVINLLWRVACWTAENSAINRDVLTRNVLKTEGLSQARVGQARSGSVRIFIGLFAKVGRRTVQPIGQHEDAKDHEDDDEDVVNFHGFSLSK